MKISFLTLIFILTLQVENANAFSLNTQFGHVINGFDSKGLNSSDFTAKKKEDNTIFYENKFDKSTVQFFTADQQRHIYFQHTDLGVKNVTSALVENDKLVSQINCIDPMRQVGDCYVVTEELCKEVLKQSGKKTFAEFTNDIKQCEKTLNVYQQAINNEKVSESILNAYKQHNGVIKKQNLILSSLATIGLWFGNYPILRSSGAVEQITDYRIYGMINTCSSYLDKKAFVEKPAPEKLGESSKLGSKVLEK